MQRTGQPRAPARFGAVRYYLATARKGAGLVFLWLVLAALVVMGQMTPRAEPPLPESITQSKPYQRWWWAYQQRAYPLSAIPEAALERALDEMNPRISPLALAIEPVRGIGWTNIGPAPIWNGSLANSGRVADIAVDPANSNHWLIGAAQGGLWETRDAGRTWTARTDSQASLATGAIAFAPSNPNIAYAGTGEAVFATTAYAGAGLLKSTNGGLNWQLLAAGTFGKASFSNLEVNPTNANILVAATARGAAGRNGDGAPNAPSPGVYKSSTGGTTWFRRLSGEATDVKVNPTNFSLQYAALGDIFGNAVNGVYRSINAGDAWTRISGPWTTSTGGVGRVELAIAPANPGALYVSIQDAINSVGKDNTLLGLWRTTNAWTTSPAWTKLPNPPTQGTFWWYAHEMIVDRLNWRILYLGEINLWKYNGTSWSAVDNGIHVDQHTMAWAGSRLLVGNDGGVWSSLNGGLSWASHNSNLAITQFYYGALHPTSPSFALGGSQDNGTEKWLGRTAWQQVLGGDGATCAFSSRFPNSYWAVSMQNLQIFRTRDGGSTFFPADSGLDNANAPFIAQFARCPSNENIFIAGTDRPWKCTNFFNASTPTWISNGTALGAAISALAFAPSVTNGNSYALGTAIGQLRRTTNGGVTWVNLDPRSLVPDRYVTGLAFHPTNASILYVILSGFNEATGQAGHLFRTTNALASAPIWSNLSPPVNLPLNCLVLDPVDPKIIYTGSDLGVWKSINEGRNWTRFGPESGLPNVAVFDLQINPATRRLVAFTHGRGAFLLTNSMANLGILNLAWPSTVSEGQNLTYSVVVTNQGPNLASSVTLETVLPTHANLVAVSLSQGSSTRLGNILTCNLGTLTNGATATVTLTVASSALGSMSQQVNVKSNATDPTQANNTLTLTATIVRAPILELLGADVWLQFATVAGSRYRLERTDDLAGGVWTAVADTVLGTGEPVQILDPNVAALPHLFYRILLLP